MVWSSVSCYREIIHVRLHKAVWKRVRRSGGHGGRPLDATGNTLFQVMKRIRAQRRSTSEVISYATKVVRVLLPSKKWCYRCVSELSLEMSEAREILLKKREGKNRESSSATCTTKRLTSLTPASLRPKNKTYRKMQTDVEIPEKGEWGASNERVCACRHGGSLSRNGGWVWPRWVTLRGNNERGARVR